MMPDTTNSSEMSLQDMNITSKGSPDSGSCPAKLLFKCNLCQQTFPTEDTQTLFLHLHENRKLYSCDSCVRGYKIAKLLNKHLLTHAEHIKYYNEAANDSGTCRLRNNRFYLCVDCGKKYKTAKDLRRHQDHVHTHKKYHQCSICQKSFSFKAELSSHMLTHSKEKPHECDSCPEAFRKAAQLTTHRKEVHPTEKPPKCSVCHVVFGSSYNLAKHKIKHVKSQTVGADQKYKCPECSKEFSYKSTLRKHMDIHANGPAHLCHKCGQEFKVLRYLKEHVSKMHSGKKVKPCNICGKLFHDDTAVAIHTGHVHKEGQTAEVTPEKKVMPPDYSCPTCGKRFKEKPWLQTHILTHSKTLAHKCPKCDKEFKLLRYLRKHMDLHKAKHRCTICGKVFVAKKDLQLHTMSHTGEKPYRCEVCDKSFITKDKVKRHMLTHTGEKTHKCEICGTKFALNHILVAHQKTHKNEEMNFTCQACGKSLKSEKLLKKHLLTHIKQYKCYPCGREFKSKASLKAHMAEHVGD